MYIGLLVSSVRPDPDATTHHQKARSSDTLRTGRFMLVWQALKRLFA
jgi:hypothetical protein